MRLLCITDIHGAQKRFREILAREADLVDIILLGGDITNFGTPEDAAWFLRQAEATGKPVFAVAGNCDSPQIDRLLAERGVSLAGFGRRVGSIGFYGVSAAPVWHGMTYEMPEEELAVYLRTGAEQIGDAAVEVVLSHPPPRDTAVDVVRSGAHVGSTAVRDLVEQRRPALVVCGHVHEGRGTDRLDRTLVVNCGPAVAGYYAVATVDEDGDAAAELKEL